MKKIIAVLLSLAMLASALVMISAAEPTTTYFMPDILEEYGYQNIVLAEKKTPTLDGVVSPDEYSYVIAPEDEFDIAATNDIPTNSTKEKVSEYFAYDDDYIYYAFYQDSFYGNNSYNDFRIQPAKSFASVADIVADEFQYGNMGAFYRMWNAQFVSTEGNAWKKGDATKYTYADCGAAFAGSYTEVGFMTYEVKISREFLAEQIGESVENVTAYACFTRYRYDSVFLGTPVTGDLAALTGKTFAPRYIVLADDIDTSAKASVRISSVQNGLRFKTNIREDYLNSLKAQYGAENVSVGTLIAATDVLGENALTHEFDGIKLDIPANVDLPFASANGLNTYAGSITNIKPGNLDRDFTAVGYIKIVGEGGTQYIYSEDTATRSAAYVAEKALAAAELDSELYTADQIAIIKKLIPAVEA